MKPTLRAFIFNLTALQISVNLIPGFTNSGGIQTLIISTIIFGLMNQLVRPIVSMLFLPINLITMGAFRWLINVCVLFLLTLIVYNLNINSFLFHGIQYKGFIVPQMEISYFWTLALTSAVISLTNAFLYWLIKDK